MPYLNFISIN